MTKAQFYTGRLFYLSGKQEGSAGWYYETREGVPQGPFPSREEARNALDAYLAGLSDDRDSPSSA